MLLKKLRRLIVGDLEDALRNSLLKIERKIDQLEHGHLNNLDRLCHDRFTRIDHKIDQLEYYSHGSRATYIGHNRVLVKAVVGGSNIAYIVEADDKLLSPWFIVTGAYELELTDFFLKHVKPDSHSIDVGANFGFFSCLFARLSPQGRIIAVEADRHVHELCRDNLAINGFGHGKALHAAANETGDPIILHRRVGRSANTSIIAYEKGFTDAMGEPPAEQFSVAGIRLDSLLPRLDGRVDFLKIDVEGAEPLALRGAQQIIATNPQLQILMEWSPGQIRAAGLDVAGFLAELNGQGLRLFRIEGEEPAEIFAPDLLGIDYLAGVLLRR